MATLKLIKGLSYSGSVHATQANPLVEVSDTDEIDRLTADGYFQLVGEQASSTDTEPDGTPEGIISDDDSTGSEVIPSPKELEAMTKAELSTYADAHSIDITTCKTKADLMQAISVYGGGSYTMMDIQQSPNSDKEE